VAPKLYFQMFSSFVKFIQSLPRPVNWIVGVGIVGLLIGLVLYGFNQVQACGYDKARKDYQTKETQLKAERDKLLEKVAERDKRIAELEPQAAAFRAAAEQGKKVDDDLAQKIEQIAEDAAKEMDDINQPADCWVRSDRTCTKLKQLKPPIVLDCDVYKRKICSN
jgi:hypothetical protein